MAVAKKCDICGSFYEYEAYQGAKNHNPNGISFVHINMIGTHPGELIDCCPKCMHSIQVTIELLKGGKENESTSNAND